LVFLDSGFRRNDGKGRFLGFYEAIILDLKNNFEQNPAVDVRHVFEKRPFNLQGENNGWDEIDKDGKEFALGKGMKFIPLSKQEEVRWNERVKPILDDYVKDMKAKNLPGEEALKFAQDYLKANQK